MRDEVIRLKALNPGSESGSCRKIAAMFCAIHFGIESVSKTWVATVLRDEKPRIEADRRKIRRRKPAILPRNRIWGMDLTSVTVDDETLVAIGIVDHGTRACISLTKLESKHSWILLRELCAAIREYGKPARVRTDNEAVFTSRLFRWGLGILGVRHETTEILAPWQNGRIERFFGSFKGCWRLFLERAEHVIDDVQAELDVYRAWYNHVRPHMHLGGRVPADVWNGVPPRRDRQHTYFSEWEEVLTGFHFR